MTFSWFGGAIHRDILKKALVPLGVSARSIAMIGKGTDSQDIPFSDKYGHHPQNHCDDDQIQAGRDYFRERIKQAVADAKDADTNIKHCHLALYEFGEGMHTVQDFYSHANYLEWLLQTGKTLEPIDWDRPPGEVHTAYYYFDRPFVEDAYISRSKSVRGLQKKDQHLHFHSEAEFAARKDTSEYTGALDYALAHEDFLHKELNKDSAKTMEGKIVAPKYKKTFHQLARELATTDTARQWNIFEQSIKDRYGERSERIIAALKGRKPAPD